MLARRLPFRPAPLTSAITRALTGPVTGGVIASTQAAVDILLTLTGAGTTLEGSVYTLNVAASGADAGTISAYEIDWGDGTVESGSAGDNTHTYADGLNSYSIKVEATHATGIKRAFKAVTVTNVVPIVTLSGAGTAYVDQVYTVTIGAATDPGADTISNYRVNWGDGTYDDYATPGDKTHTYAEASASLDITLDITDEDGTYTAVDTLTIEVSAQVLPLFSRDYEATGSLGADATFTRASTATVTDFEDLVKIAKSGEARFQGLRRVENLLPISSVALSMEASGTTPPTVTNSATYLGKTCTSVEIPVTAGGYGATRATQNSNRPLVVSGVTYTSRVSVALSRTLTAGELIFIYFEISGVGLCRIDLTEGSGATAEFVTFSGTSTSVSSGAVSLGVQTASAFAVPITIYVTDVQLEDVTGQTNQNPSEYVSVGVLSAPYHGAGVDGVKYFATENGNTVTDNVVTEGTGAAITGGALLMEPAATNYLLNSGTPATQTTGSLGTGTYVLWVEGSGSAAVTAGTATITGGGTATDGTPDTFTVTGAGTVTVTVTGTLDRFQLEAGSTPTSYIPTSGSAVTRAADALSYPFTPPDEEGIAIFNGQIASSTSAYQAGWMSFRNSRTSVMYTAAGGAQQTTFDGTYSSQFILPLLEYTDLTIAARWGSSGKQIGGKDGGSWSWSTENSYDGAYVSDGVLNIAYQANAPTFIYYVHVYDTDQGTDWIEGNY